MKEREEEWDYVFVPQELEEACTNKKPVVFAAKSFKIEKKEYSDRALDRVATDYGVALLREEEKNKALKYEQEAIRWKTEQRPAQDGKPPSTVIRSNARLIEWSDGTFQLAVGDTMYDLDMSKMKNTQLLASYETDRNFYMFPQGPVEDKMTLKSSFLESLRLK
eukprot:TRINITY_DN3299_c0_g1_i1.p1 TRINITY_DN3299_c0_g1~~TRINITY_DN3299_c0_g1_i1.p1  ORF type:complete len:164 (-),score=51.30 TRINITY_DN3299_c0_g1_i1:127-618(-)